MVDNQISLSNTGAGVSSGKEIDEKINGSKKTTVSARVQA
jgi:hypothetical protein